MGAKREIATTVLTLGLSWLWKKYIAKKVAKKLPAAVHEMIDAYAVGHAEKLPTEVKEALDAITQARVDEAMRQMRESAERMQKTLTVPPPPILQEMATKREAAIRAGKAKIPPRGRK